ncbi:hypothetical protein Mal4_55070 [Maioricimonas rarisocia]|uniref:Uncharacterized protein n=1 Tax=Maioricimonas rarisocia TaxID=2528026 RepID=A0A517ZFD1_9PLAN|nr:hypothetical protein [Maioricimonas rarisocia]QDU41142.1 hypothetical protein Mal4_55070 [Maioricimonas rarisocia]
MRAIPRSTCCRWTSFVFQCLPTTFAIVAVFGLLRPAIALAQSETDLNDVQEALTQWRETFDTIRVEYRIACRQQLQHRFRDEEFADDFLEDWGHHGCLVWAGDDRFILDVATLQRGEIIDVRRWGRDEEISWMAEGSRSRGDDRDRTYWWAVTLRLTRDPDGVTGTWVLPLTGLFDVERAVWIDEILSDTAMWSAGELVEVDGHECLELTRTVAQPNGHTRIERRIALDPARGYLPRQVREIVFWGSDDAEYIHSESVYEVTEFQTPQPGFWFPRRGTWLISVAPEEVYQWGITTLAVDPELPAGFSAPPDAEKVMFPEAEALARLTRSADPERVDAWMNWSLAFGLLLMGGCAAALAVRWKQRAQGSG